MRRVVLLAVASVCWVVATVGAQAVEVSILADLDPERADRSVIVESITADQQGRLYLADWVTGNVLRVDPKTSRPVVVGRIEAREIGGKAPVATAGESP